MHGEPQSNYCKRNENNLIKMLRDPRPKAEQAKQSL